jgi:Arc-like DNA binding domain
MVAVSQVIMIKLIGMCQEWTILLGSVDLVQARNCQVRLTHAIGLQPIPSALAEELKKLAKMEDRSINSEVVRTVREHILRKKCAELEKGDEHSTS